MDADRFDGLVRSFGQARSRRQTLRGLVGAAAAGALALGGQEADAATRIGGSSCTRGRQCKTGKCIGTPGHKTCSCSKTYPTCTSGGTCLHGGCFRSESCATGCGNGVSCGAGVSSCYCSETVGGVPVCYSNENFCTEGRPCQANGDCPVGQACVNVSCVGCSPPVPAVCLAPCPVSP